MTTTTSMQDVVARRTTARQLCLHIQVALGRPKPAPTGSMQIYTWRDFEWFWVNISHPPEAAPGLWARPIIHNVGDDVSVEEMTVWCRGTREFFPTVATLAKGCENVKSEEQYEIGRAISNEMNRSTKRIIVDLEKAHSERLGFLYSDSEEAMNEAISLDRIRQRRKWLVEVIQAHMNLALHCQLALPSSRDMPNHKIMQAFLAGWIPVGYVGPLKTGSAVVFHPAIKSPP